MALRERQFNLVVGAKGHGKSTYLANLVWRMPDANALVYKEGLNVQDAAFKKYREVSFYKYKGGKVIINGAEIEYKDFVPKVYDHFRNGSVIIDDTSLYESDVLTPPMKKLAIMGRHVGIDLFLVYHGVSDLPIKQFPYVNNIILFHTSDNIGYKAKKIPGVEKLIEAKERIAKQVEKGNKYYFEVIKFS